MEVLPQPPACQQAAPPRMRGAAAVQVAAVDWLNLLVCVVRRVLDGKPRIGVHRQRQTQVRLMTMMMSSECDCSASALHRCHRIMACGRTIESWPRVAQHPSPLLYIIVRHPGRTRGTASVVPLNPCQCFAASASPSTVGGPAPRAPVSSVQNASPTCARASHEDGR